MGMTYAGTERKSLQRSPCPPCFGFFSLLLFSPDSVSPPWSRWQPLFSLTSARSSYSSRPIGCQLLSADAHQEETSHPIVRTTTCIGLAMAIENLRPNNTDQSELSQPVGAVSDRHGGLAWVQRRHRSRFCPYGSVLRAPLETMGAFFLSVRPTLLRLRLFRSFATFAAGRETPQPREAVDPQPGRRPRLGTMERGRADTQRARCRYPETVKVKFPVRQAHSILGILPITCPA